MFHKYFNFETPNLLYKIDVENPSFHELSLSFFKYQG